MAKRAVRRRATAEVVASGVPQQVTALGTKVILSGGLVGEIDAIAGEVASFGEMITKSRQDLVEPFMNAYTRYLREGSGKSFVGFVAVMDARLHGGVSQMPKSPNGANGEKGYKAYPLYTGAEYLKRSHERKIEAELRAEKTIEKVKAGGTSRAEIVNADREQQERNTRRDKAHQLARVIKSFVQVMAAADVAAFWSKVVAPQFGLDSTQVATLQAEVDKATPLIKLTGIRGKLSFEPVPETIEYTPSKQVAAALKAAGEPIEAAEDEGIDVVAAPAVAAGGRRRRAAAAVA